MRRKFSVRHGVEAERAVGAFHEIIRSIALAGDEPVLASIAPLLRELLEADQSGAYRFSAQEPSLSDTTQALDFAYSAGLGPQPRMRQVLTDFLGRAKGDVTAYGASAPDPAQRNIVHILSQGSEALRARHFNAPIVQDVMVRLGIAKQDQIRVLVCEGAHLLTWIGAFRLAPFDAREKERLAMLVAPLAQRLKLEERLQRLAARSAALDVALDALGTPAYFLDRKGKVVHANQAGRALGPDEQAALLERGKGVLEGRLLAPKELSLLRIEADGVPPHSLLIQHLDPTGSQKLAAFQRERMLSRRQRQVLEGILEGKSNKMIGTALGIQESTVELHVTSLLRKVGAESRSELVATFWAKR